MLGCRLRLRRERKELIQRNVMLGVDFTNQGAYCARRDLDRQLRSARLAAQLRKRPSYDELRQSNLVSCISPSLAASQRQLHHALLRDALSHKLAPNVGSRAANFCSTSAFPSIRSRVRFYESLSVRTACA